MFFREGARLFLSCVSEREAEMRITPTGKNVTSLRVRCSGKWGIRYYELTCWDDAAVALNNAVGTAGLRIIAVGLPKEQIYKEHIQYKMNVEELWVEDIAEKRFAEVISKNGVPEVEERVYEPIEVPDSLAVGSEAVSVKGGKGGKGGKGKEVELEDVPF